MIKYKVPLKSYNPTLDLNFLQCQVYNDEHMLKRVIQQSAILLKKSLTKIHHKDTNLLTDTNRLHSKSYEITKVSSNKNKEIYSSFKGYKRSKSLLKTQHIKQIIMPFVKNKNKIKTIIENINQKLEPSKDTKSFIRYQNYPKNTMLHHSFHIKTYGRWNF